VKISTKKNFFYHNNNYLYDTKLWLHILAANDKEILLGQGNERIVVSVLPVNARIHIGITDDQHTSQDFLDELKSEPLEYDIGYEETDETNPLTDTPLEE
jgi:hypothetical protein